MILLAAVLYTEIRTSRYRKRIDELESYCDNIETFTSDYAYKIDQLQIDFLEYLYRFYHVDKNLEGDFDFVKHDLSPEEELSLMKTKQLLREEGIKRGLIRDDSEGCSHHP